MAKKDVQIKELFGNLSNTGPKVEKPAPEPEPEETLTPEEREKLEQKAYRERVDAVHGKPTTIRLKPDTIKRVNMVTRKLRVKKGDFYNFAINYFLDLLEEDSSILPVRPAKYEIDIS